MNTKEISTAALFAVMASGLAGSPAQAGSPAAAADKMAEDVKACLLQGIRLANKIVNKDGDKKSNEALRLTMGMALVPIIATRGDSVETKSFVDDVLVAAQNVMKDFDGAQDAMAERLSLLPDAQNLRYGGDQAQILAMVSAGFADIRVQIKQKELDGAPENLMAECGDFVREAAQNLVGGDVAGMALLMPSLLKLYAQCYAHAASYDDSRKDFEEAVGMIVAFWSGVQQDVPPVQKEETRPESSTSDVEEPKDESGDDDGDFNPMSFFSNPPKSDD